MKVIKSRLGWTSIAQFCLVKIFPSCNGVRFISRGSIRHYETLRQLGKQLKNQKFYLYQRQPIDISFEMIKNNVKTITYITRENFETVQAIPIEKNQKQTITKQMQLSREEKLLRFIKSHKFVIKKSFLDLHPYEAYCSLCSFLGTKRNQQITKIYHYCSFSLNQINQNTVIYPFLNKLRHRYLNVEGELKLQKLDRLRNASVEETQSATQEWKKSFWIDKLYSTTKEEEQFKRNFVLEHNLGEQVKIEDLLEGYGEKCFYASWKNQSLE